jgi:hypothetical protein
MSLVKLWRTVVETFDSLRPSRMFYEPKHASDQEAYAPKHGQEYVGRHRRDLGETPYKTPGRATDRGNWGDEQTGLYPVVQPMVLIGEVL